MHILLSSRVESRTAIDCVSMLIDIQSNHLMIEENTLILGVGNLLCGDDGAGPQLIELLSKRNLPSGIHLQDAGLPGWELPSWLEGWNTVFLIDAIDMGLEAGSWRSFRPEQVKLWLENDSLSLHQSGLACGLALADELGMLPERLMIYGIQPGQTEPGQPLSPPVAASLNELADQIILDIGNGIE
jgi:hydrogenase maturation protease